MKKEPRYLTLYEKLRRDIESGAYRHGTKLPSKRTLADDTGVSVITVEHAYALLADEGYITPAERSGYFVTYREGDAFPVGSREPVPHPALTSEEQAEGFPFSVYARTMRRVISDYGEEILVKSPNEGCPQLKEAIAAYLLRSRGLAVTPEQIVIGSGAEYLYGMIVQLLGRERRYAIEKPSYEKIEQVYAASGVTCCARSMISTST